MAIFSLDGGIGESLSPFRFRQKQSQCCIQGNKQEEPTNQTDYEMSEGYIQLLSIRYRIGKMSLEGHSQKMKVLLLHFSPSVMADKNQVRRHDENGEVQGGNRQDNSQDYVALTRPFTRRVFALLTTFFSNIIAFLARFWIIGRFVGKEFVPIIAIEKCSSGNRPRRSYQRIKGPDDAKARYQQQPPEKYPIL